MNEQKKTSRNEAGLNVVQPLVAGVDIGSEEHWAAGPPHADGSMNVRRFKTTSVELNALVTWLEQQKIESVAMESTGVYWIPLYEMLEARGIKAVLVNARDFAHAPGRPKTDRLDCQWLQRLHGCGLVRGSFRPHESFIAVRSLQRVRANLVHLRTRYVQWMQKALDQMNVQVHRAVSDLSGVTGMAIVRAIVGGERSPAVLAELRDHRCKKSAEEIAEYLTGTWRDEHLFTLASALRLYDTNDAEIAACDVEVARRLDALQLEHLKTTPPPTHPNANKEKLLRKDGGVRDRLWRASGADITRIDGISSEAAQVILAELGTEVSAFPDERHFVSWLRLCPPTKISGGKSLKTRRNGLSANRVAGVLRMAALGASRSKTAIGAYFRRVSRTKGYTVAIFATARKLAQLLFRTLRYGHAYVDIGERVAESQYEARRVAAFQAEAKARGFTLVPIPAAVATS